MFHVKRVIVGRLPRQGGEGAPERLAGNERREINSLFSAFPARGAAP
jgi:hypothetical protein